MKGTSIFPKNLDEYKKTGYLHEDFRLFHLKDKSSGNIDTHFHDFHKIIIPISGDVKYQIEGKTYTLHPLDIILVSRFDLHKPLISELESYERIVIWIQNHFIESDRSSKENLAKCFVNATKRGYHLVTPDYTMQDKIRLLIEQIESSLSSDSFGSSLLATTYFQQLLIFINRLAMDQEYKVDLKKMNYDHQIEEILRYLNQNLSSPLCIDFLADKYYISKYHLMHKFKKETGYTVHRYIEEKRLVWACSLIRSGVPVIKASRECGFADYSTFLRSFHKKYNASPTKYFES
ncbi:MAG: AraC family transcriptional regulator [Lachnospiraceae bacterium]